MIWFTIFLVFLITVDCQARKYERNKKPKSTSQNNFNGTLRSNIDEFSAELINKISMSYVQKNFVFSPFSIYSTLSVIGRGNSGLVTFFIFKYIYRKKISLKFSYLCFKNIYFLIV